MQEALAALPGGWPENALNFVSSRQEAAELLQQDGLIDLVIPRGGNALFKYVKENTNIPVLGHADGVCHIYIAPDAAPEMAQRVCVDAKTQYPTALQQRNALLKMEAEPDVTLMELWEQQMAMNGELLFAKRQAFVNELIPLFQQIYQHISGDKEQVGLHYISHCQRGPLLEVIQRDRFKDRAVGYSLHGVHRDDLEFTIGDYQMKREGSQGQNKSYVIALKLAQFSFLKRTCSNTTPLLLLDDIFDKLDAQRVEAIVQLVSNDNFGQIFITDTNRDHLDQILHRLRGDYKIFSVENGELHVRD